MNATSICPECSRPLPAGAPQGLCPSCLLQPTRHSIGDPPRPGPNSYTEPPESETQALAPGTRLGYVGDYELLSEIARGGMGIVYRARQSSLKRIVAVKTIRSGVLADDAEVRRFRTEAEAAASLHHPNIVAVHEVGEHQGRHYYSMDFIEGSNLAQIVAGKPVPAEQAGEWVKTIAEAVHFAHQRGVLHRDLKPQNILVNGDGRPYVTDFGLARRNASDSRLTQTGAVMGSPSYMAPEQASGRNDRVGPASDVWSLGAMLYELLTGRPPFRGESAVQTLHAVLNDEPARPRSLNPAVPLDLETVCMKCLEKEPLRRYATAKALAEDLARFLSGEPVEARPAGSIRRTVRWIRRHDVVTAAVVSTAIFVLGGLAYGLWEQTQYLSWRIANPGQARVPGALTAWLTSGDLRVPMQTLTLFAFCFYARLSRGSWISAFRLHSHRATLRPIKQWQAVLFCSVAAGGILMAFYNLAIVIQAFVWERQQVFVWEGHHTWLQLLLQPGLFFGVLLLILVVPEQLADVFGLKPARYVTAGTER